MSIKKDFSVVVRVEGKITIPIEVRKQLNIEPGDALEVSVKKSEWYELVDWSQMSTDQITYNSLAPEIQLFISSNYSCDATGNTWGED